MKKKTLKLKKFNIHPIFMFIILSCITVLLSWILSVLQVQVTYNKINPNTLELEATLLTIENLFNYNGLKYIISSSVKNLAGFAPLGNLLISLLGISVAYATGLIDAFAKRVTLNIDNKKLTFLTILIATISSLVNDVGYVVLIPLSALIFSANKRNPMLGVIAAYCGVAFGYGATVFVGSMEVNLIPETTVAARLIDKTFHVSLTSNLIIIIAATIITSIVGTIIFEKIIVPKFSKVKEKEVDGNTKEINLEEIKESERNKIETDFREKKGLKKALIVGIIFVICFIYMLIPSLPFSGLLLDMNEKTYLGQVFGENSYFQDGFTYMISLFFIATGLAYGISTKSIRDNKDLINRCCIYLSNLGMLIALMFFASQFIAIFRKTNIGPVIVGLSTKFLSQLSFSGIPLIITVVLLIVICNLFVTTPIGKWEIMAPVVVPLMMQSNISPQFAQFILRASDSMAKGITPLLAYFVIYIGYLNIYNTEKEVITVKKAIGYIMPYCLLMAVCWLLIIIGWYLLGAPIGIGVSPTL